MIFRKSLASAVAAAALLLIPTAAANAVITKLSVAPASAAGPIAAGDDRGLRSGLYDVKAYGAVGNGVADDTTAVLAALTAALAVRGALYFPAGSYLLSGSGSEILLVNKSIEIFGDGLGASVLLVAPGVPVTRDVIRIKPPAGGAGPNVAGAAGRDNRGYYLHDFAIRAASGTPGRNAIRVDTTSARSYFHGGTFERLGLHFLGGSPSLYFNNDSGGVPANTDGIWATKVIGCQIFDGFLGDYIGDSITFTGNEFREYTSANRAVDVSFVPGAASFTFSYNNVYNKYGIRFKNGIKIVIGPGNQIEGPEVGFVGSNGAVLDLDGSLAKITGASVFRNQIGAHSGAADGIRVNNAADTTVDDNTFSLLAPQYALRTTASAVRTQLRRIVINGGVGTAVPTPMLGTENQYLLPAYFSPPPFVSNGYVSVEQGAFQRFNTAIVTYAADVTMTTTDLNSTVVVNASGAARTVKLPPHHTGQSAGRIVRVVKNDSSGNAVTVRRADATSDTINGAATLSLPAQYNCVAVQAAEEAGVWYVVGRC